MARLKSWSRPHVSMSLKKVIQNILNYVQIVHVPLLLV